MKNILNLGIRFASFAHLGPKKSISLRFIVRRSRLCARREARVGFLRTGLEQLQADLGQLGFGLYARGWNPGSQVIPELLAKAIACPDLRF